MPYLVKAAGLQQGKVIVPQSHDCGRGRHVHSGWLPDTRPKKGSVDPHIAGRRKGEEDRQTRPVAKPRRGAYSPLFGYHICNVR